MKIRLQSIGCEKNCSETPDLSTMDHSQQERAHSDFKIIASGKSFPVHRYMLHQSSEYFRAMLSHGMKELSQGYCEVSHDAIAVEQCIEFMYNKRMDLQPTTVASVFKLSHQWLLEGAVARCVSFMQRNVSAHNCVEWINLSKLYAVHELEATCITFLVRNLPKINNVHDLDLKTLKSLADSVQRSPCNAKILWNIIQVRIQLPDCNNPCRIIQAFHVEKISKAEYQSCILKNEHIVSCASCNEYITKRRQAHAYKIEDVTVKNCLPIKNQVVKYEASDILTVLDKYIVKHFKNICMLDEFLTLVSKDDLLAYICKIHRSCTDSEFTRIVEWFRHDQQRETFFPKLFTLGTGVSSKFKNCLHTLSSEDSEYWLFDSSNCCFLRYLAEKHSCRDIFDETDYFLDENFLTVSTSIDIAYLSVETMETYVKTEDLYDEDDGLTMWNAVRLWANIEERRGREDFSLIFCSLLFHKFSLSLLQQICEDKLVKKSTVCCSKLAQVTLSRISQNKYTFKHECNRITYNLSVTDGKLQTLKERTESADARNNQRWRNWQAKENEKRSSWNAKHQSLQRRNTDLAMSVGELQKKLTDITQRHQKDAYTAARGLNDVRGQVTLLLIVIIVLVGICVILFLYIFLLCKDLQSQVVGSHNGNPIQILFDFLRRFT